MTNWGKLSNLLCFSPFGDFLNCCKNGYPRCLVTWINDGAWAHIKQHFPVAFPGACRSSPQYSKMAFLLHLLWEWTHTATLSGITIRFLVLPLLSPEGSMLEVWLGVGKTRNKTKRNETMALHVSHLAMPKIKLPLDVFTQYSTCSSLSSAS